MRYYNRNPIQARATNGYEIPKEPKIAVKKIENKEDYIRLGCSKFRIKII